MNLVELKEKAATRWRTLSSECCCIFVDPGSSCASEANAAVFNELVAGAAKLKTEVRVIPAGSLGWCEVEPVIAIQQPDRPRIYYGNITPAIASELLETVVAGDDLRRNLALCVDSDSDFEGIPPISTLPFFTKQNRLLLRNCGRVAAEDIDSAIISGAYESLGRALDIAQTVLLEQLVTPLGDRERKWRACRDSQSSDKSVVATVAEGGELSRDVFLIEGDPHTVLEGLLIAAYAVGANRALVCVDPRDVVAKRRVEIALEQMKNVGLVGESILGSKFGCTIELRDVQRGFGGEEDSILINFLEGRPARASVPFQTGSDYNPHTLVAGMDMFAKVSAAMRAEPQATAIRESRILAITGSTHRTGVVEVSADTSVHEVVHELAGGVIDGSGIKAVQIGAPGGGFLSAANLDCTLGDADLAGAGCALGSGSLVVVNSTQCAVDLAREAAVAAHNAACGQCTFGREGTRQLMDVVTDLTRGRAKVADLDLLASISDCMKLGSLCANGRKAPDAVVTTLQHFRSEYEAHVNGKQCPTEVCEMK